MQSPSLSLKGSGPGGLNQHLEGHRAPEMSDPEERGSLSHAPTCTPPTPCSPKLPSRRWNVCSPPQAAADGQLPEMSEILC